MPRLAWVLLVCPLVAPAAPVPKVSEKEQIEKTFGTIEDPDKECTFGLDGDKLKITLKGGKRYDWDRKGKVTNCPRVVREVKGDFVTTVKAHAELPDKAEKAAGEWAEVGAGLIVMGEKDDARRTGMHDFRLDRRLLAITIPNLEGPGGLGLDTAGEGVYVRFTRKADWLATEYSLDGKKWKKTVSTGSMMSESYRVGVYASSNSKSDVTVTLSEFSVEPLKEENKEEKK